MKYIITELSNTQPQKRDHPTDAMDILTAIDVIESIAGTTDESTPAGEAWAVVLSYVHKPRPTDTELAALLRELAEAVNNDSVDSGYWLSQRALAAADQLQPQEQP